MKRKEWIKKKKLEEEKEEKKRKRIKFFFPCRIRACIFKKNSYYSKLVYS
jgi:hypothetical protein